MTRCCSHSAIDTYLLKSQPFGTLVAAVEQINGPSPVQRFRRAGGRRPTPSAAALARLTHTRPHHHMEPPLAQPAHCRSSQRLSSADRGLIWVDCANLRRL
eukprot:1387368-Pleurochrysis_carterae.AAC.2